jgi:Ser/Thr protein kinase RdoA (MazF antagonist)
LRSVQEIQAELDLLAYLDAQGVPVVPALLRPSGDLMLPLTAPEGDRVAALFRHVDGEPLSKNPDPAAASAYGNAIARVHVVADAFPLPLSRPRITPYDLLERPLGALAMVLGKWDDRVAELREAARILRPILDRRPVSGSEYGLIHGDVIPSNAHVGPDGTVTLLDFDFCGYGWRALDIATYLMEVDWWETSPQAGQAFLDEYQQVRPLSDGEIAALPSLEAARAIAALGTPAREVNVWGSAYLSPAMVDRTLAVVRACLARAR